MLHWQMAVCHGGVHCNTPNLSKNTGRAITCNDTQQKHREQAAHERRLCGPVLTERAAKSSRSASATSQLRPRPQDVTAAWQRSPGNEAERPPSQHFSQPRSTAGPERRRRRQGAAQPEAKARRQRARLLRASLHQDKSKEAATFDLNS